MKPDLLDLILLVAMLCYAVGGFRNGALLGGLSFAGFFGGAAAGAQLAKPLGRMLANGAAQVPVAIVCVLFFAMLGQLVAVWVAGRLRSRVTWHPARRLDQVVGSVFSVLAVLLVAWMVALPLAFAPFPTLSAQVRRLGDHPGGGRHAARQHPQPLQLAAPVRRPQRLSPGLRRAATDPDRRRPAGRPGAAAVGVGGGGAALGAQGAGGGAVL